MKKLFTLFILLIGTIWILKPNDKHKNIVKIKKEKVNTISFNEEEKKN